MTVGGGAVRFPIDACAELKDIIEAPSLDVVRGLDARTNIGYAVEAAAASESESEVHEDYVSASDLERFAESALFVRHSPEQNPLLRDLLPTITTPFLFVAARDDLVPWSNNQYLDDLLPNSEIHPLDAGHFAWEQAADDYGRLVSIGSAADIGASRPSDDNRSSDIPAHSRIVQVCRLAPGEYRPSAVERSAGDTWQRRRRDRVRNAWRRAGETPAWCWCTAGPATARIGITRSTTLQSGTSS